MRASSWLGRSWDSEDIVHSAGILGLGPGPGPDGRIQSSGVVSRREKFRRDAGPSREELSRSRVLSVLCNISPPSWLRPADGEDEPGRQVRIAVRAASESEGNDKLSASSLNEQLKVVLWPTAAVLDARHMDIMRVSWDDIPESADPVRGSGFKAAAAAAAAPSSKVERALVDGGDNEDDGSGHGECAMGRGERKRSQVETIASALSSFRLKPGSRVVDFGCGSGALTLPLAALFPTLTFVGVDCKPRSICLLEERARKCTFRNVVGFCGLIETFSEPFDACVSLHACGIATDLALLQALRQRASYVMSPCCVGKLRLPFVRGTARAPSDLRLGSFGLDFPDENRRCEPRAVDSEEFARKDSNLETPNRCKFGSTGYDVYAAGLPRANVSLELSYPRSGWLRSCISASEFLVLARAADWSSYDRASPASIWHSLCKILIELDRNEASQEMGYWTSLSSLPSESAGTIGVSHVLVGFSQPP